MRTDSLAQKFFDQDLRLVYGVETSRRFENAWNKADITITSSRF